MERMKIRNITKMRQSLKLRKLRNLLPCLVAVAILWPFCACSPKVALAEGEVLLAKNTIKITEGDNPPPSALEPYLKQVPAKRWNILKRVEPVIYDSALVRGSEAAMARRLEYLGYYGSQVWSETEISGKKGRVTYFVRPGKQYPVSEISYRCADTLLLGTLMRGASFMQVKPGVLLSQEALEADAERMASMLRNQGYYGFNSNYFFYAADTVSRADSAILTLRIEDYTRNESPSAARPHRQFNFGKVEVVKPDKFEIKDDFVNTLNLIREGRPYREMVVNTTYDRLAGVPIIKTVNIQLTESDTSTVDCRIALTPAKLQSVKVNLEGSLNSTGLFGVTPSISYTHRNLFKRGEVLTVGVRGNFQFKLNESTSSEELGLSSTLLIPRFLLFPSGTLRSTNLPQTEVALSFNYQHRPEYTRTIFSTSYGYVWSVRRRYYYQFSPIKFNSVRIFDITDDFYEKLRNPYLLNAYKNHFDLGAGASFYYTGSAAVNPRSTYFYLRCSADISGNILSLFNKAMSSDEEGHRLVWGVPYAQYVRGEVSAVQTVSLSDGGRHSLAGRLLAGAGYAYGNSTALPFEKFFYGGGANSLRGWMARSVGPGAAEPQTIFQIANQTGDIHLEANLEYRFPISGSFFGALFADGGNIFNIKRKGDADEPGQLSAATFFRRCALDFGTGLRLDLGMLLARVDVGFKAYDPVPARWLEPDEWFSKGGYAIHFGIGYPF